jgi:hypothetical protein
MPDLSRMREQTRRLYERGRALAALRVAFVIVPLTALCMRETDAPVRCAMVGVALLIVAMLVRWRQHRGVSAVDAGLMTGVIPMTAALLLCRFAAEWPADAATGVCAAAGFVSGGLTARATMGSARAISSQWLSASLVAGLTAALGCVGIGFGTAVGAVAGVVIGAIVAAEAPRGASA